ncbi:MAG: DUF4276 family protein [Thermodesulfobacteriota bacterium]
MHVEFLLEETSAEEALKAILPKILGLNNTWTIHAHQGKRDLLAKLENRLKGYSRWLPEDSVIVVLIDEDRRDCLALKQRLENTALVAGLGTSSHHGRRDRIQVVNRIAVEELEAWFFGDMEALLTAYPRIFRRLDREAPYRDPDAIRGGTWEALARVLKRAGYLRESLSKIEVARTVSRHMDPRRNKSRSFCCFRDALGRLQ